MGIKFTHINFCKLDKKFSKFARTFLSYIISFSIVFSNATLVLAQTSRNGNIVVDNAAHTPQNAPNFGPQSNGVDVLNVVKPTDAGVSHNKFTDFNVDPNGLIVNNLNLQNYSLDAKSVLSGQHVEFNKNFGTGNAAKVILNEVTSNSTSSLKGYTEIYGQKADYIITNPNGITCAGCGFINTSRLAMVTGSANMQNGDIKDFKISPVGVIKIEGVGEYNFGMNISGSPADIVSNAIKIAGNVYSDSSINFLTGNDNTISKPALFHQTKIRWLASRLTAPRWVEYTPETSGFLLHRRDLGLRFQAMSLQTRATSKSLRTVQSHTKKQSRKTQSILNQSQVIFSTSGESHLRTIIYL